MSDSSYCALLSSVSPYLVKLDETEDTPSIPEIIWVKNVRAIVVCGFLIKSLKNHILRIWKKWWVPFGSYLLNSTADSAQFECKWAGLAVLFSRYLPNGTHDFFQIFRICFFKDFIKNPQTTIALTFLTHIISGIDGVAGFSRNQNAS